MSAHEPSALERSCMLRPHGRRRGVPQDVPIDVKWPRGHGGDAAVLGSLDPHGRSNREDRRTVQCGKTFLDMNGGLVSEFVFAIPVMLFGVLMSLIPVVAAVYALVLLHRMSGSLESIDQNVVRLLRQSEEALRQP